VSDSVKMSEKAFKTYLHFTLALPSPVRHLLFSRPPLHSPPFPSTAILCAGRAEVLQPHSADTRRNHFSCVSVKAAARTGREESLVGAEGRRDSVHSPPSI
jgi:hypothetical protein